MSCDLNARPLCAAPFTNKGTFYMENGVSKYTPCCYRGIPALNESDWQGPELIRLRKGLTGDGPLDEYCKECLSFGALSTAMLYNSDFRTLEYFKYDPETGRVREEELTSSIFIGGKCNLGCRMCNGAVSSTFNYTHPERKNKTKIPENHGYSMKPQSGVTSVCVAGGEPLLVNDTIGIVESMAEVGGSSFIISNASVDLDNNPIYKAIVEHKEHTYVMVSLDADYETHEWIRCGIDIELMKHNIKRMHEDGVLRAFNIVISSMNYNKFLFPIQLADELGIRVDITFLNNPSELSCKYVPVEDRKKYAAEVYKYIRDGGCKINNKEVVTRSIRALCDLPYEGDIKSNPNYIYMTRDI